LLIPFIVVLSKNIKADEADEIAQSILDEEVIFIPQNDPYQGDRVREFYNNTPDKDIKQVLDRGYTTPLNLKNPVFIISEDVNSTNYSYSNNICNTINLVDSSINCVVYPTNKKEDIPSFLRRGTKSDAFDSTGVNGDFTLIRSDVFLAYQKNEGYLKGAPFLDAVAFMNGDYMLMYSHKNNNMFSLEQLIFYKGNKPINIGYINPSSKNVFESIVKPLFPRGRFFFKQITPQDIERVTCLPTEFDLIIFLGNDYPPVAKDVINKCANNIVPITLSTKTIKSILEKNPVLSAANVVGYYDVMSVSNFLETYLSVEKSYKQRLDNQKKAREENQSKTKATLARRDIKEDSSNSSPSNNLTNNRQSLEKSNNITSNNIPNNNISQPKLEAKNNQSNSRVATKSVTYGEEILDSLPGERKALSDSFKGVFPNIQDSIVPANKKKIYLSGNVEIKTFGIRYVLVASRYTKKDNILRVFDAIIKDYINTKENFLTPDMKKFSVQDIVIGTNLNANQFSYHPAILQYPRSLLERKVPRTSSQNLAIKAIVSNISVENIPAYYGPVFPDNAQLNFIYNQLKELNKKKQELVSIKIFQRDINNIQSALNAIKNGEKIDDSVLESTGIYSVDTSIVDHSVLEDDILEQ
jgi:hypothetical protein